MSTTIATPAPSMTATTATATSGTADAARTGLAGNFNDFLTLLMTQLKNQDPSNPLDTNQFTSQLVQFASVEQQINANSNLTQLIQLTQGGQMLQAASLVGKNVLLTSDHIPLQDGTGQVDFTTSVPRPVLISITTDAGIHVRDTVVNSTAGANQWNWDGTANNGARVPDGSYHIVVQGVNADGSVAPLAFTVRGTATGVARQNNTMQVQLGAQLADFASVQQVLP